MIKRTISAGVRAFLVALLIAMPALMLSGGNTDSSQIVALLALLAALMTFVEYVSDYPSLIEFRNAPPFNRLRFIALFLTVLVLTLISHGAHSPSPLSGALTALGSLVGNTMDFPFSPVRLVVLILPEDANGALLDMVRTSAGLAYFMSLSSLVLFVAAVRVLQWPLQSGAFNVWVNLPLFDPTTGGDVLYRLKRDSQVNIALGFLLPFLIPAIFKFASALIDPFSLADPQTLIWTVSAWAFLPASMIMRGVALLRIADLIEEKRRRAYAQADQTDEALQPA